MRIVALLLTLAVFLLLLVRPAMTEQGPAPSSWVALEIGLDRFALAASGITPSEAQLMRSRVDAVSPLRQTLGQQHEAVVEKQIELTEARTMLLTGEATPTMREAVREAEYALEQARANVRGTRGLILGFAEGEIDEQRAARLRQCIENRARNVPPEMRVLDLTEAQWRRIESALRRQAANEARIVRGETPRPLSTQDESLLWAAENEQIVATAAGLISERAAVIGDY